MLCKWDFTIIVSQVCGILGLLRNGFTDTKTLALIEPRSGINAEQEGGIF